MSDDKIWNLIDNAWNTITEAYEIYKKKCPELIFHNDKKEKFDSCYKEMYSDVKKRFMTNDTDVLDSHKQAALLTICCLKLNIIEYSALPQNNSDELHIIPQIIAINVGLSYMLQCLNDSLRVKKIDKQIQKYYFPVALACNTPYEKIVCRILYFEQHESDMNLNVLDLADRYFLIEYINLLQHGIEPCMLKESD